MRECVSVNGVYGVVRGMELVSERWCVALLHQRVLMPSLFLPPPSAWGDDTQRSEPEEV